MNLLIATDHRFLATAGGIYDTYCYDRRFFDDYRSVFEHVRVAARVRHAGVPGSAARADGDGVEFLPLPHLGGLKWLMSMAGVGLKDLRGAVASADAVCVRVPSVAGAVAFYLAQSMGKPVMFEVIGDPVEALRAREHGPAAALFGKLNGYVLRSLTQRSVVGSYVSRAHLQQRYPPGPNTVHDSISSIRLPAAMVVPAKRYVSPRSPFSVVLVASLVPVKRHDVLIRAIHEAKRRGASFHLKLVGGGVLRPLLEGLVQKLDVSDSVTFYGHVADRTALTEILDASDLFVMTSASEGMPRAMIEAMARGLPAVGSATGGIAELLTPSQVFPIGDHCRLGEMLVELQRNPALLQTYAEHSERTARAFTHEVLGERRRGLLLRLKEKAIEVRR